jgi:hypothetical protein
MIITGTLIELNNLINKCHQIINNSALQLTDDQREAVENIRNLLQIALDTKDSQITQEILIVALNLFEILSYNISSKNTT